MGIEDNYYGQFEDTAVDTTMPNVYDEDYSNGSTDLLTKKLNEYMQGEEDLTAYGIKESYLEKVTSEKEQRLGINPRNVEANGFYNPNASGQNGYSYVDVNGKQVAVDNRNKFFNNLSPNQREAIRNRAKEEYGLKRDPANGLLYKEVIDEFTGQPKKLYVKDQQDDSIGSEYGGLNQQGYAAKIGQGRYGVKARYGAEEVPGSPGYGWEPGTSGIDAENAKDAWYANNASNRLEMLDHGNKGMINSRMFFDDGSYESRLARTLTLSGGSEYYDKKKLENLYNSNMPDAPEEEYNNALEYVLGHKADQKGGVNKNLFTDKLVDDGTGTGNMVPIGVGTPYAGMDWREQRKYKLLQSKLDNQGFSGPRVHEMDQEQLDNAFKMVNSQKDSFGSDLIDAAASSLRTAAADTTNTFGRTANWLGEKVNNVAKKLGYKDDLVYIEPEGMNQVPELFTGGFKYDTAKDNPQLMDALSGVSKEYRENQQRITEEGEKAWEEGGISGYTKWAMKGVQRMPESLADMAGFVATMALPIPGTKIKVAEGMIAKLFGSPLAAKIVGKIAPGKGAVVTAGNMMNDANREYKKETGEDMTTAQQLKFMAVMVPSLEFGKYIAESGFGAIVSPLAKKAGVPLSEAIKMVPDKVLNATKYAPVHFLKATTGTAGSMAGMAIAEEKAKHPEKSYGDIVTSKEVGKSFAEGALFGATMHVGGKSVKKTVGAPKAYMNSIKAYKERRIGEALIGDSKILKDALDEMSFDGVKKGSAEYNEAFKKIKNFKTVDELLASDDPVVKTIVNALTKKSLDAHVGSSEHVDAVSESIHDYLTGKKDNKEMTPEEISRHEEALNIIDKHLEEHPELKTKDGSFTKEDINKIVRSIASKTEGKEVIKFPKEKGKKQGSRKVQGELLEEILRPEHVSSSKLESMEKAGLGSDEVLKKAGEIAELRRDYYDNEIKKSEEINKNLNEGAKRSPKEKKKEVYEYVNEDGKKAKGEIVSKDENNGNIEIKDENGYTRLFDKDGSELTGEYVAKKKDGKEIKGEIVGRRGSKTDVEFNGPKGKVKVTFDKDGKSNVGDAIEGIGETIVKERKGKSVIESEYGTKEEKVSPSEILDGVKTARTLKNLLKSMVGLRNKKDEMFTAANKYSTKDLEEASKDTTIPREVRKTIKEVLKYRKKAKELEKPAPGSVVVAPRNANLASFDREGIKTFIKNMLYTKEPITDLRDQQAGIKILEHARDKGIISDKQFDIFMKRHLSNSKGANLKSTEANKKKEETQNKKEKEKDPNKVDEDFNNDPIIDEDVLARKRDEYIKEHDIVSKEVKELEKKETEAKNNGEELTEEESVKLNELRTKQQVLENKAIFNGTMKRILTEAEVRTNEEGVILDANEFYRDAKEMTDPRSELSDVEKEILFGEC